MPLNARIAGLGAALPATVISSRSIEEGLGLPDGWCERLTGVRERRRAITETAVSLAAAASHRAIERARIPPDSIDLIIGASSAPHQAIPCTAALVHRELGMPDGRGFCFDVNATCLSFPTALEIAARWIDSGRIRAALVFSSETTRQSLNPEEPESYALIGDAAAAAVLTATPEGERSALIHSQWSTHSSGAELTRFLGAGTLHHPNDPATTREMNLFSMQGREVLRLAARVLPAFLDEFFRGCEWDRADVRTLVPHQASRLGLRFLTSHCGFRDEQIFRNLETRGNCVAASMPLALVEAVESGRIERGDPIVLLGTGAGFSMGALAVRY